MKAPRLARDIMVTRLATVETSTDLRDGVSLLLRRGITGAPVVDTQGRYLGMFSESPAMKALTQLVEGKPNRSPKPASEFMATRLVTLRADMDAFEAIGVLLKNRISGAPVVNADGAFLGVFSERYAMSLLIQSAYEHWPSTQVGGYMNIDRRRLVDRDAELLRVARMFLDHYFRRLPVIFGGKPVGQISRRDVLRAELDATSSDDRVAIGEIMDTEARTIHEELDLLTIAQIFQSTNCRRLPVLRGDKLVGQISRRDILAEAKRLLQTAPQPERALLYLSATRGAGENPPFA